MAGLQFQDRKKLVIVGGGTAGWIVAASLARHLGLQRYEITIVESSHISTIGGGESVLPSFLRLLSGLGLDERAFIEETGATLKFGTLFRDWLEPGRSFFHPIGSLGCDIDGLEFFHCWLKAKRQGDTTPLADYAPATVLAGFSASEGQPHIPAGSGLFESNHSLHIDSARVRAYLTGYAEKQGVERVTAHIVRVNVGDDGCIASLELNNRQTLEGDFFFDCSGFRGLLIDETLGSSYEDWGQLLPCDRAVSVHSENDGTPAPFTTSTARESGWAWRIPLQTHTNSGYVFSSELCSETRATQILLDGVKGKLLTEPHTIPLRPGMRRQLWNRNCIAVGLAGGFLEPLESATIHLVTRGVGHLLRLFPDLGRDAREWTVLADEYNVLMKREYEEIRDFTVLHYCFTRRVDSEFWRRCQSREIPDRLAAKIRLFQARGELRAARDDLFRKSNWQAVLTGMGVTPVSYHPLVDSADFETVAQSMRAFRTRLEDEARAAMPVTGPAEPLAVS